MRSLLGGRCVEPTPSILDRIERGATRLKYTLNFDFSMENLSVVMFYE
ncbi:MAG: hypothetical protein QXH24_00375 [Candidatus Bathyarchaeia archaeon]